jgi:hypothetical protein
MTTTTTASIGGDSIPKKELPGEWNRKQRNMDEMLLLL